MRERLVEDDFLSKVYKRIPSRTSFNQHPDDLWDIFGSRKLLPVIHPNIPWDDLHIFLHWPWKIQGIHGGQLHVSHGWYMGCIFSEKRVNLCIAIFFWTWIERHQGPLFDSRNVNPMVFCWSTSGQMIGTNRPVGHGKMVFLCGACLNRHIANNKNVQLKSNEHLIPIERWGDYITLTWRHPKR